MEKVVSSSSSGVIVYIGVVLFRTALHSASAKIRHPSFSCGHFNCIEKLVFPLNQYMVHKFSLQSVAANAHIHWQRMTCQTVLQMETRSVKGKGL